MELTERHLFTAFIAFLGVGRAKKKNLVKTQARGKKGDCWRLHGDEMKNERGLHFLPSPMRFIS